MPEKPDYYQRVQQLLRHNYNKDLSDFNITTPQQLTTQWPSSDYSPAEVVDHYAHKHELEPLWK